MRLLPASICLVTGCFTTCTLMARAYSFESLNCLFLQAHPLSYHRAHRYEGIPFSFSRVSPGFAAYPKQSLPQSIVSEVVLSTESEPSFNELQPSFNEEKEDGWPIFAALKKWQNNPELAGLSYNFNHPHSVFALDYSDIFETGRAPYKGSHGVSLFFRHTF